MISYAQNFEDIYIARAFADVTNGFYVDLGAYDPFEDSVTAHFYLNGWSGINVEPGPSFANFEVHRARDINVKAAATDFDGRSTLFFHQSDPGTSTLNEHLEPDFAIRVGDRVAIDVSTVRLTTLLREYAEARHVHFLKIDVEGLEEAIVRDTDWQVHRPELLIIESTLPYTNVRRDAAWAPVLANNGYVEIYFDGINVYHLREESMARAHAFRMPVNVLDQALKFSSVPPPLNVVGSETLPGELPEDLHRHLGRLQSLAHDLLKASDIYSRRSYAEQNLLLAANAEAAACRRDAAARMGELSEQLDATLRKLKYAQDEFSRVQGQLAVRDGDLDQRTAELGQCKDELLRSRGERDLQAAELAEVRTRLAALDEEKARHDDELVQQQYDFSLAIAMDVARARREQLRNAELTGRKRDGMRAQLETLEQDNRRLGKEIAQQRYDFALTLSIEAADAKRAAIHALRRSDSLQIELDAANGLIGLSRRAFFSGPLSSTVSGRLSSLDRIRASVRLARIAFLRSEEERVIIGSGLFDEAFYLRMNPDVASAGIDALRHYLVHGSKEGRRPHALFDDEYYRASNPDVRDSGINPLLHFVWHGFKEGRRPNAFF